MKKLGLILWSASMVLGFSCLALQDNTCTIRRDDNSSTVGFIYYGDCYAGGKTVGSVDVTKKNGFVDIDVYVDRHGTTDIFSRFMNYVNACSGIYIGDGNNGKGNLIFTGTLTIGDDNPIWASNTSGNPGAQLAMKEDGNLVICKPIWSTNTFGHPGADSVMQPDGNLVIYDAPKTIWAAGTENHSGAYYYFYQHNGSLMVYAKDNSTLWSSPSFTTDNKPYQLISQNDGNLVICDKNGKVY